MYVHRPPRRDENLDPETLQIIAILAECGVKCEGKTRTPATYTSVVYIQRTFKLGADLLKQAVEVIQEAMFGHDDATDGALLIAVAGLIKTGNAHGGKVDLKRLVTVLSRTDVAWLSGKGLELGMGLRDRARGGTFVRENAIRAGIVFRYNVKRGRVVPLAQPWDGNKFLDA